jgi:uncharacterized membrane protein
VQEVRADLAPLRIRGRAPFITPSTFSRNPLMSTSETLEPTPATPVSEDRTIAIVAYITLIGFIVAIILHGNKKTRLGAYHLRQSLGLMLAWVAAFFVTSILAMIPFIGWILGLAIWGGLFVLWLLGLLNAANGQLKPVPYVGVYFEKWFGQAFE